MPPRRQSKPNIKSQIIKALYIATNNDPTATVALRSIVDQALHQINGLANFPVSKLAKERLIKGTIRSMKDNKEIGYEGRNQYSLGQAFHNLPKFKVGNLQKIPPEHFKVPSRKRLPEISTPLDPGRKRRHPSIDSLSSISGDKFEQTRKQFYGTKKIVVHEYNPNLPGARQVAEFEQLRHIELSELPGTSVEVYAPTLITQEDVPSEQSDKETITDEHDGDSNNQEESDDIIVNDETFIVHSDTLFQDINSTDDDEDANGNRGPNTFCNID